MPFNHRQNRKLRFTDSAAAAGVVLLLGGVLLTQHSLADSPGQPASNGHSSKPTDAKALFQQYCYDCHGDGMDKGSFALDELLELKDSKDKYGQWEKTWKIVLHEFMPPAKADRPTDAERKAMTRWIAEQMLGVNWENPDPGRVTIRRLNRMEYEFTVTDLFGVDLASEENYSSDAAASNLRLRDRLPPDDTAFGFDNIGDFQSLSPALLEKYFDIAEYVVDNVISVNGPRYPVQTVRGDALKTSRSDEAKRTEQTAEFQIQRPGKYRVEVQFSLGGWIDFGGTYDFAARVNEQQLLQETIDVGGQKTHKYSPELQLMAGTHHLTLSTLATKPNSKGDLAYLELRPRIKIVGPLEAAAAEYPETHRRIFFDGVAPADEAARRAYAREIIRRISDRAFRRPTDEVTLDRLTDIAMRHKRFEAGVGEALTAILVSPKFLFRAELQPQPDDPKTVHLLDEYALASRLSYMLWLSIPDAELTQLAAKGKLRANLKPEVERMLADPKAARFFEDFPGQWLRTRNILMTAISRRDEEINPVRGAMKRETEMLFEYIARNDRDLIELVTADYTFVDRSLADFYRIEDFQGEGFQKVQLSADSKRGGILTQGSFLAATSNPNRTSPVKRGLFVLENLLGTQPPPPPANVPALDDAKAEGKVLKTVRDQLAAHREDKSCAACHAHFDPIGIVLENYDVVGKWRTEENGEPIHVDETTVTGDKLRDVDDLKKLFATRKDKFYQCVAEKLLTYALGRGLEPADITTIERIADQLMANNGKFSTLLMAVVESPAFQTRRGDDGRLKEPPKIALPEPPPPEKRKGMRRRPNSAQAEQNASPPAEAAAATAVSRPQSSPEPN